jgi:hypothetical protein
VKEDLGLELLHRRAQLINVPDVTENLLDLVLQTQFAIQTGLGLWLEAVSDNLRAGVQQAGGKPATFEPGVSRDEYALVSVEVR